jgi:hypothetical protein
LHVGRYKVAARPAIDIGLMQRPGVNDRRHAELSDRRAYKVAVGDRSDDTRRRRGHGIEPDHVVAATPQPRDERPPQPARRARDQDSHSQSTTLVKRPPYPRGNPPRSCGAAKSRAGPFGTMRVGLIAVKLM